MRKFLQAVLDWVDHYVAIFVVISMFALTGLGGVVFDLVEEQKANSHNQLINRATNVESWCGGINQDRDYNRAFVRRVTRGTVAYTLGDKDCEALIRKTLESPTRKGPITAKSNPLVYRVLRPQPKRDPSP